jgi:hypothetical protein
MRLNSPKRSFIGKELTQTHSRIINWSSRCFYGYKICSLTSSSPRTPKLMDWASSYPHFAKSSQSPDTSGTSVRQLTQDVTVADVGCGFGGLLMALGPKMPNDLLLGKFSYF